MSVKYVNNFFFLREDEGFTYSVLNPLFLMDIKKNK